MCSHLARQQVPHERLEAIFQYGLEEFYRRLAASSLLASCLQQSFQGQKWLDGSLTR